MQRSKIIKRLLRFEDLEGEVFEPNNTLVITDSDLDGTKCSEVLKKRFPLAQYFYVDAGIVSNGATPPSEGDVYKIFNETDAILVIIADIGEVYFWADMILDKVERNPELKVVIFDHHYLIWIRKKLANSVTDMGYEWYGSREGRQIRRAFYTLNKHPRISFYWDHVHDAYPIVKKWLSGELDCALRKFPSTVIYVCKQCDKIVSIDERKNHLEECIGLGEDQATKFEDRIKKLLESSFVKVKVEFKE